MLYLIFNCFSASYFLAYKRLGNIDIGTKFQVFISALKSLLGLHGYKSQPGVCANKFIACYHFARKNPTQNNKFIVLYHFSLNKITATRNS